MREARPWTTATCRFSSSHLALWAWATGCGEGDAHEMALTDGLIVGFQRKVTRIIDGGGEIRPPLIHPNKLEHLSANVGVVEFTVPHEASVKVHPLPPQLVPLAEFFLKSELAAPASPGSLLGWPGDLGLGAPLPPPTCCGGSLVRCALGPGVPNPYYRSSNAQPRPVTR